MLHLVTRVRPSIPVVLVDTGHLFPETYRFVDELTEQLRLNLRVFRSAASPAWQKPRWGRLWEQGIDGIERYNHLDKVEPMECALGELGVGTRLSGLRRAQGPTRAGILPIELRQRRHQVRPLFDCTDRDVHRYLKAHGLPYHPLHERGYLSIGDWHTTRSLAPAGGADGLHGGGPAE